MANDFPASVVEDRGRSVTAAVVAVAFGIVKLLLHIPSDQLFIMAGTNIQQRGHPLVPLPAGRAPSKNKVDWIIDFVWFPYTPDPNTLYKQPSSTYASGFPQADRSLSKSPRLARRGDNRYLSS